MCPSWEWKIPTKRLFISGQIEPFETLKNKITYFDFVSLNGKIPFSFLGLLHNAIMAILILIFRFINDMMLRFDAKNIKFITSH